VSPSGTSRSLLARVRNNEAEAWDQLVRLYAPLVQHWLRSASLDEDEAADVFQDVFQAAAQNIARFRKEKEGDTFRGWLRTITRNKANDCYRRRPQQPRGIGGSEMQHRLHNLAAPDPDRESPSQETGHHPLYHRALALVREHFTEGTWNAFRRTVLDGQAPRDVAQELGMSPGAVRVAKSRVLQRLRSELGDLEE